MRAGDVAVRPRLSVHRRPQFRGRDTPGDIDYTSVYSRGGQLVFSQFPTSVSDMDGAVNVPLDSFCSGRMPEHVVLSYDAVAHAVITDAFTHDGPFNPSRFNPATCAEDFVPGVTATDAATRQAVVYENGGKMRFGFSYRKVDAEVPPRCYARPEGCPDGG